MTSHLTGRVAWWAAILVTGALVLAGCKQIARCGDDDDTRPVDDDDTSSAGDDDIEADDDTASADDDSSADDDDSSSTDDDDTGDDDTAPPCDPLGPSVTPTLGFGEPDWQIQLFIDGLDTPAGLAADSAGDLVVGAGVGSYDYRPVLRITPSLTVTSSSSIRDPDGVGVDSTDQVYAAGWDDIHHLDSLMPGADPDWLWHTMATGGNINDFVLDAAHGDVIYLELDDGRVVQVEQSLAETVLMSGMANPAIDVDGNGDLWVLDDADGELYLLDVASGVATVQATWGTLDPDYTMSNRIAFNPADGRFYASTYYDDIGGTITRWDPADPGALEVWVSNMSGDDNPDDLLWMGGCLYVSQPLGGRILRICECG